MWASCGRRTTAEPPHVPLRWPARCTAAQPATPAGQARGGWAAVGRGGAAAGAWGAGCGSLEQQQQAAQSVPVLPVCKSMVAALCWPLLVLVAVHSLQLPPCLAARHDVIASGLRVFGEWVYLQQN